MKVALISIINIIFLVRKSIRLREDIGRRTAIGRVVTIATTILVTEEATAAVNIPEEILAFDGLTNLMEYNRQQVHLLVTINVTMVK